MPLRLHGHWGPPKDRQDPIALLERQGQTRVGDLLPIRYGRMLESPLAFYRGAALIMTSDLAGTPVSGFTAQLCGDANLENFGGFTSAEGTVVFDINDFDETLPGPWEWDLKRLAASVEIAGRQNQVAPAKRRGAVWAVAEAYRSAMREFAASEFLDVWYRQLDAQSLASRWRGELRRDGRRRRDESYAIASDNQRALERDTRVVNGEVRLVSNPPRVQRYEDLMPADEAAMLVKEVERYLDAYRSSLTDERRHILDRFVFQDLARTVVGVGSVGTRTNIALLLGKDNAERLVLQVKEAGRSVLESFLGKSSYSHGARRVVEGQRLMQASPDVFLGWVRGPGMDGIVRSLYVRQLWDWKVSPEIRLLNPRALRVLAEACAWTLARAHARSSDRIGIASYLGTRMTFARAIEHFATAYADQNEQDYMALITAVGNGRIVARPGV